MRWNFPGLPSLFFSCIASSEKLAVGLAWNHSLYILYTTSKENACKQNSTGKTYFSDYSVYENSVIVIIAVLYVLIKFCHCNLPMPNGAIPNHNLNGFHTAIAAASKATQIPRTILSVSCIPQQVCAYFYAISLVELATPEGIESSPPPESGRLRLVDILVSKWNSKTSS